LPAQISCGSDVFTLTGGTTGGGLSILLGAVSGSTATITMNVNLTVSGPNIGQAQGGGTVTSTTTSAINNVLCDVQAQFAIDATFPGFSGLGTIPNCNHYSCVVDNQAISCGDLQSAMSNVNCD
jgi:hypothetical protein